MEIKHNEVGKSKVLPLTKEESTLYEALKELPKPIQASGLSTDQVIWWYWFGNEFLKTRQFSKLDLTHLQKAAFWMDARCKAIKKVNERGYFGGLVQEFKSGASNVSAHVTVIEKADKHLDEVSAHFGLSFKDRQKLKTDDNSGEQLSLFDQVVKKIYG
ncbi:conserved hypothetical protein [Tenacibaculum sp. 190524A02b]|uniref:Uncharacterized protein n=1 Tax=Tenacibaculum vairaonense TaxID=3137860 RepID=A0ABP1F8J0_9FLAO